ncbi:hypothetical protein PROFUN_15019 [Planoprotostelium fungivorum]|uniref:PNPLA domain-containing protein n=1 Tax=Planoprotostelium fungivorum TaxID=1890364 RepID=A0A2P6MXZ7_9EUKA|nr:hypothetical protein PROFUN_15019 [Planoprotostelium fungivorum]
MPSTSEGNDAKPDSMVDEKTFPDLPRRELYLCLSGGGIRSAALSWGLLEYMLTNHFNIKQMYCVSGSGYAAASFIQNVFHDMERGLSYDEAFHLWIKERRLERYPNAACDCHSPLKGLRDSIIFTATLLLTFVWAVFTHVPVFFEAALIAAIFGGMLRQDAYYGWYPTLGLLCLTVSLWLFVKYTKTKPADANNWVRAGNAATAMSFLTLIFGLQILLLIIELPNDDSSRSGSSLTWAALLLIILLGTIFRSFIPGETFGILSAIAFAFFCSLPSFWRISHPDDRKFDIALGVSCVLYLIPFNLLSQTWLHTYYRWRLQRKWFKDSGFLGLSGIISQRVTCGGSSLTLGELSKNEALPIYSAVASVNGWKHKGSYPLKSYIMTMNSGGLGRIHECDIDIKMRDYRLSSSMATSSAAISVQMGEFDNASMRFWQSQCGFGTGNWMSPDLKNYWTRPVFLCIYQTIFPIVAAFVAFRKISPLYLIFPFSILVLTIFIGMAFSPTNRFVRSTYWIPLVFTFYQFLDLYIVGSKPHPPRMYLSDVNFHDNLGLLPAIKERRPLIVTMDATEDPDEKCGALMDSMNLCRTFAGASFTPITSSGVSEERDMVKFVNTDGIESAIRDFREQESNPMMMVKVKYQKKGDASTEGIIIYLKPRRKFAEKTLGREKIENLHGMCFSGCHRPACSFMRGICGEFPNHKTNNQFITSEMFRAYSDLGHNIAQCAFQRYHQHQHQPPGRVMQV